ncbi:hypothetical protein X743_24350 [Mesorhizobium sp. LNHC252B00]|nr:hypothetical protein X743_24350 [Mesorhizobium sp. LNHC252B00]
MLVAQKWLVRGTDMHESKDLRRAATPFGRLQNFLLPMTLK